MPANLNALIRYKTINSCLLGGKRRWSIGELINACSEALADSRGRYDSISERTVRDDIRVMRSDILGFNAPIEQKQGLYFYSDPAYSIMSMNISDSGLADRIIDLLRELQREVRHPELEVILEKLLLLSGHPETFTVAGDIGDINEISESRASDRTSLSEEQGVYDSRKILRYVGKWDVINWGDLLELINYS